jgi:DNA-binding MarR family transcriptional regulator
MSDSSKITKLVDKLEGAKARIERVRKEGEVIAGRVVHTTLTVAGGATVGALRGLMGDPADNHHVHLPGTKVQAELALGLALTGASIMGAAGKYSDHANSLGSGMLAVIAAEKTMQGILDYESKSKR